MKLLVLLLALQFPQAPSVTLKWKASASQGVTSYRVLRSPTANGVFTRIALGITGTSYTDKAVIAGKTYFYVVRADCPLCVPPVSKDSNQAKVVVP
jgi:fibronectin type 3 domain-containing protein